MSPLLLPILLADCNVTAPPYVAAVLLLLVKAPTVPVDVVPLRFKGTALAVRAIPFKSNAAPLLTVTPEVLSVPLPKAPAAPSCKIPPVTLVAPV